MLGEKEADSEELEEAAEDAFYTVEVPAVKEEKQMIDEEQAFQYDQKSVDTKQPEKKVKPPKVKKPKVEKEPEYNKHDLKIMEIEEKIRRRKEEQEARRQREAALIAKMQKDDRTEEERIKAQ